MYAVIVNPIAGGGKAVSVCQEICRILSERGIAHRVDTAEASGHAVELTRAAVSSGCSAIVGIGGDGTLSEITSGLVPQAIRFFIVPCGTGNDFAHFLKLSSADPVAAFLSQLDGEDTFIDMATVNGQGFLNVAGTGFDVDVLREVTRFKHMGKGLLPYLMALVSALRHFKAFSAELTLDTGEVLRESFTIISIGNGAYFGGGMKVAPYADVRDGLLEVMIIRGLPKFAVPFLLPLFIGGWHARLSSICRIRRCRELRIVCPGMTFNMDGELTQMDSADVRVLPGHLPVRLPGVSSSAHPADRAS